MSHYKYHRGSLFVLHIETTTSLCTVLFAGGKGWRGRRVAHAVCMLLLAHTYPKYFLLALACIFTFTYLHNNVSTHRRWRWEHAMRKQNSTHAGTPGPDSTPAPLPHDSIHTLILCCNRTL
ncbi:hypothetical protein B0H16DRAFT_370560 [Mycena metata]|uniref:Uncharacterized protein n=1 Tax=Mycena metata TaxID=1033252 RepID=A0AAD7NLE2_9AGAR|nr:hypothetical protein B0H16DRAFT_370560 [Mycena metata]